MSILDKFLNVLKINDDPEYDEDERDYLDDDDPDYNPDERPRGRILPQSAQEDDEDDDLDEDTMAAADTDTARKNTVNFQKAAAGKTKQPAGYSKVSPIRSRRKDREAGMEVCVIRPHTMEDAREITDTLLSNCTVVLNLEGMELDLAQRIIDFTSGSCYAIDGNLQKITNYIFIITPSNVEISGDFQEVLTGAFDVPFEKKA